MLSVQKSPFSDLLNHADLAGSGFDAVHPLPSMNPPSQRQKMDDVMSEVFPHLFSADDGHDCVYRRHLLDFLKQDLQKQTTDFLAGKIFYM